jgi:hypothetical protein
VAGSDPLHVERVASGAAAARIVPAFVALAILLLVLALLWRVPMMLWDHLDLVPIYERFVQGTLDAGDFFRIHGGHLHAGAYAVLLWTTALSHGGTWLDGVASWLFLLAYAGVIVSLLRRLARERDVGQPCTLLIVFLVLYPGHLANLQWGWQVAVFICLAGMASTIALLAAPVLRAWHVFAAIACASIAFASFAVGFAVFPAAIVVLALRREMPWRVRCGWIAVWAALALAAMFELRRGAEPTPAWTEVAAYVFNFLGAGLARYATDLAPWLGIAGIVSGGAAAWVCRAQRSALAWIGLFVVGAASALLTAYGRVDAYGADQAFVTRYVSFSSVFWIGWLGLLAQFPRDTRRRAIGAGIVASLFAALAVFNAAHLMKKAATVARRAQATAQTIRQTYPDVPEQVLAEIYFDQPDVARERLERLHAWGFAPFDREARQGTSEQARHSGEGRNPF